MTRFAKESPLFRKPLLLFLACFWILPPVSALAAAEFDSTVLIYHRFGEDEYPTTNVGVGRFREQMAFLAANDYRVIPLAELVAALNKKKQLPEKSVVITIDDGYKSVYRHAWPILKAYGYPFTVFINAKSIDSGFSNYMNWAEVLELHGNGVDIQDHSYGHDRLADRPGGMSEGEYRKWISDDLGKNSKLLFGKLGVRPRFFAIPYGEYNRQVMAVARQLGYEAILTQDPGSVSEATDPHMIPREPILGNEWATMSHFKYILGRVDLPIADMRPPYGNIEERPESYGARIVNPDRYEHGSFGVYVSELGWLEPQLKGNELTAAGGGGLTRKLNRVMVKAREKESGRVAVRSWLLVRDLDP